MYKKITISILFIISIFLIAAFTNYLNYREFLNKETAQIKVEEREDLERVIKITDVELQNNGFSFEDIKIINNYKLDNLHLDEMLKTLGEIKDEKIIHLKYNNDVRTVRGNEYASLSIEPTEALYIPQQERTYIKIYYTVNIESPILFGSKGKYLFNNNDWINLFGYTKLHYVSEDGEEKNEYIRNNLLNGSSIQFNIKNKHEGKVFYLKGISGTIIANKNGYSDISSYSEYSYHKLLDYKRISRIWMDFSL